MMRTNIVCLLGLLWTAMAATGCSNLPSETKVGKNQVIKKYSVDAFNRIENWADANIVFTQGATHKVEASGADKHVAELIVTVKDSALVINMDKKRFRAGRNVRITLSVVAPDLCSVRQEGVGNISLKGRVKTTALSVEANGVGNLDTDSLVVRSLEVSQTGVGSVKLCGRAQSARYRLDGVGSLKAKDLQAVDVVVEQNGVGSLSCYASGSLKVDANGIGSVDYYGNPGLKEIEKSGIGGVSAR